MADLRLAWRNLWRHRARTAISAATISLGLAALLAAFGLSQATYEQVLAAAVRTAGGHVLVHAEGWQRGRAADLLVDDPAAVADAARRIPGVRAAVPRMIVHGLLASARGAEPVRLVGADPAAEAALVDLAPRVAQGTWLAPDDPRPLVLGAKLARRLGVGLGDRVVLTAADASGDLARALFRVSGVLEPRAGLEDGVVFTSVRAAAAAVGAGSRRTEVGLVLEAGATPRAVAASLGARTGGGQRLELVTWDEALPDLLGAIRVNRSMHLIFGVVVFVVMAFGTANTLLMSVLERVRELGLLSALGMTPARTARLVLAEAGLLAAFSVALGFALGLAVHLFLSRRGVELGAVSRVKVELSGVMIGDLRLRSAIEPLRWVLGGVAVWTIVVASAGYAALRAARLDPVVAMRTYE